MKIAILTLQLHSNYGGIIQNYALQEILKQLGHEVYTIRIGSKEKALSLKEKAIKYPVRLIRKLMGRKDGIIFIEQKKKNDEVIAMSKLNQFINNNIRFTTSFYTTEDLRSINYSEFDAIVVGSDQVWRPAYLYPTVETFFLDFIENKKIKKIAYAASFGTDEIEFNYGQIDSCRKLISDFYAVSVREQSAIDLMINKYNWNFKRNPVHVLDPTLLLDKQDYLNLIRKNNTNIEKGDLFCFLLDNNEKKNNIKNKISSILSYKPYKVEPKSKVFWDSAQDKVYPGIEEWLQGFNQAKYVFTDSFHGCVFSIIFNKPFIVIGNEKRGMARFYSLLKMFNLESRLIFDISEIDINSLSYEFNWVKINQIKDNMKFASLDFLKGSL